MNDDQLVIVALSGGVDSAVSALLLRDAGYHVQCLHMTNWEDDGYCESAKDFHDARRVCEHLGLTLHRVNFSDNYKQQVFTHFLDEYRLGRTPNPDILCNKEIKFGVLWKYAKRLGGQWLATGHYAQALSRCNKTELHKALDESKDQSYFLHTLQSDNLTNVLFPLGLKTKSEVRKIALKSLLPVAEKKDSTGICFIGERPFAEFISQYFQDKPGKIIDHAGRLLGTHKGLQYFTLGQRQGLGIGGLANNSGEAWYVAEKNIETNDLIVAQGKNHSSLYKNWLKASKLSWVNGPPAGWKDGLAIKFQAKTRYRQPDQSCTAITAGNGIVDVQFENPQKAITPGQSVVFYQDTRCLGGAIIDEAKMCELSLSEVG